VKAVSLETSRSDVRLIEPDIERDALLGVLWLEGESGRSTLALMGVADKDNKPTTLQQEKCRVRGFIENDNQLNWMISYENEVVGSIWVDLESTKHLQSPSLHIMIGSPEARGKGVGMAAVTAVVKHLQAQGYPQVYSRYLTSNKGSRGLLSKLGFREFDSPYEDEDNLVFQNVMKVF